MNNQMKEPDWSKAPEGATHWHDAYDVFIACWVKEERGKRFFMCSDGLSPYWTRDLDPLPIEKCVPRPVEPQIWNGDGLPPVGTVCEINGTVGQELRGEERSWRQVEIIAHTKFGGGDVAVGRDIECATLGWGIARVFRPLRTPEQIAAEEREKAIEALAVELAGHWSSEAVSLQRETAAYLHDIGYRKVTP